jgi:hypothetical protein
LSGAGREEADEICARPITNDVNYSENSEDLVGRFADAMTVRHGRRAGDPETRIVLDHLLPSPGSGKASARWRLATTTSRLYPPPAPSRPMEAWHRADGQKGRRLVASDLREDNRVAAVLAWHFEPRASHPAQRPHLITAAAVRRDTHDPTLRSEHLVALWLLICVAVAIDRRTIQAGRVGLVLDSGIALDAADLAEFGFKRGRERAGYRGDYYMLPA